MPPRATKRRRAENGEREDDDDADVKARRHAKARAWANERAGGGREASERSASFALTARRPSARPSAVRG